MFYFFIKIHSHTHAHLIKHGNQHVENALDLTCVVLFEPHNRNVELSCNTFDREVIFVACLIFSKMQQNDRKMIMVGGVGMEVGVMPRNKTLYGKAERRKERSCNAL